jgi:adenosylmethionine-8-amino-7-oxononanoate aminotransferase
LQRAREICNQYQVHLIADEIAVGFGRTGTMFASQQAEILPDFMCLSKGITGGYLPLSVVLTTDTVYDAFYDDKVARGFLHSHSYTGNALACSAALATLDIFEREQTITNNRQKTLFMNTQLQSLTDFPIQHQRNAGMIWAFDAPNQAADFQQRVYQAALNRGVILRPIGSTVYIMPPYVINEQDMTWLSEQITDVLQACIE